MNIQDLQETTLGLGCWPMGGEMFAADGTSLGYANSNERESIRAIQAALANGINLFDTAAAYGAGHSERLLAKALKGHHEALVVTKIGLSIDEKTKTIMGEQLSPDSIMPAIDRCLKRLDRDRIEVLLLHPNTVPLCTASAIFDQMEDARRLGKIDAYGWSTDFVDHAKAMSAREGFIAVEHAMHVLMDAPNMQKTMHDEQLVALIRSPLAMGLLSGKYSATSTMPSNDIRSTKQDWTGYFIDGKPNPQYIDRLNSVKELLHSNGRSTVQGALGWLWGKNPRNIPVPGARTAKQVEGLAGALAFGPLPQDVVTQIDTLLIGGFISDGESAR